MWLPFQPEQEQNKSLLLLNAAPRSELSGGVSGLDPTFCHATFFLSRQQVGSRAPNCSITGVFWPKYCFRRCIQFAFSEATLAETGPASLTSTLKLPSQVDKVRRGVVHCPRRPRFSSSGSLFVRASDVSRFQPTESGRGEVS